MSHATLARVRLWMAALLAFGLIGTGTELLLLDHYEDRWQLVPLFLIALALAVLVWHVVRRDAASVRALQGIMGLFLVAGLIGVGLHYNGVAAFQLEIDASQGGWGLFKKVIRAKAPPVLAPGIMMQLGLLGLAYAYRHPSLNAGRGLASTPWSKHS